MKIDDKFINEALQTDAGLPEEMKLTLGNYLEMSDDELRACLEGCDGFVFAAGVDERVEGPAPIYDLYKKYNIDPVDRLLRLCKECGVKHAVILGSYFSYAAKKWPEKELTKWHPYIRSRIDQETVAMNYASDDLSVAVLELPPPPAEPEPNADNLTDSARSFSRSASFLRKLSFSSK